MSEDLRVIRVHGASEIMVEPDVSVVSFGVQTEHVELGVAQSENARIMRSVMDTLSRLKVSEDSIQTSNYNIMPRHNYVNGKSEKVGYQVSNAVKVNLTDLSGIGKLIDEVTKAGVNMFHGVEFSVSDKTEHYNLALKKALSSAKEKAQLIAECQNVKLLNTISVLEHGSQDGTVVYHQARAVAFAANDSVSTAIASRKISVKASVEVSYSIVVD